MVDNLSLGVHILYDVRVLNACGIPCMHSTHVMLCHMLDIVILLMVFNVVGGCVGNM